MKQHPFIHHYFFLEKKSVTSNKNFIQVPKLIAVTHYHLTWKNNANEKCLSFIWEQLFADDDFRLECWEEISLNIGSNSHGGTGIKEKYNTCNRWILIFPVPFPCSSLGHILQHIYMYYYSKLHKLFGNCR